MDTMDQITRNISQYLECFEMEKFEPAKSEDDLEKRGLELLGTNQLWAGLVFVNFKEGTVWPRM